MADHGPQTRVIDLSFVGRIGFEVLPRFFGQCLDEDTSDKESDTGPLLPSERLHEVFCYDGARRTDSPNGNEGVECVNKEVVKHDSGSLCEGPFVGVREINPVDLVVLVSDSDNNNLGWHIRT